MWPGGAGRQVLNLIDGIRFNNSTFRSGPNQYLAFIEPSQALPVEALLGPAGVQYGSDALGGTINVLTELSSFSTARRADFRGDLQTFGAGADASGGAHLKISLGTSRLALLAGGFRVTERINLDFAVMNLLDKNYRVHGSGVDSPGRNLFIRLRYSF
ncbi:MAG: TonB-dependent receptor plug domain-containing protein [Blastocatellia bacterium]